MKIAKNIQQKQATIAVIGLGYVGLPLALAFAKKTKVIGFDINSSRIKQMQKGIDPCKELNKIEFKNCDILFTDQIKDLKKASFFIIAVPTPITKHNLPDLKPLLSATKTVGSVLKRGDYVVYESTVYPGCTEEDCVPVLEQQSNLKFIKDFKVGYSPERINPGDKEHTITKILKIVSGCDALSLKEISDTYKIIVEPGTHLAPSIKVAEAAKIIENTQRDVNIALMNELSIIFSRMHINTFEVLAAAATKWNFLKFNPGLVGGHCIGVDPYYLTHKAESLGYHAKIINSGRFVNDSMGFYIAKNCVKQMIAAGHKISSPRVLVMGITFKENVSDIRNSKVVDIVKELKTFGVQVDVADPFADNDEVKHEYGFELSKIKNNYHAVIVAVSHTQYKKLTEKYFTSLLVKNGVLLDIKGIYRSKIKNSNYWSL